ncbi:hypothetical protein PINS_up006287 [Pythium insidiosum]|nr:hypothetical protein PINS_up006287 [Pythium insidiosum]
MIQNELACWLNSPQPRLVGLGQAAAAAASGVERVLQFLEATQAFRKAGDQTTKRLDAARDVTNYCQELVDRMAPGLRQQLHILEAAGVTPTNPYHTTRNP